MPPCTGMRGRRVPSTAAMTSRRPRALRADVTGDVRRRGRDQRRLELLPGPGRVRLLDDGGSTRDVRRRHRRARHGSVACRRVRPARGGDADAGRGHLRLEVCGRPAVGPRLENHAVHVLAVHRADRQHGRSAAGSRDRVVRRALLPAAMTKRLALVVGELLRGGRHRVVAGGRRGVAAEAHGDDVGALRDRPLHAADDPGVGAAAAVTEHLADEQLSVRGDALLGAVAGRAGAADGRGGVRAVAVARPTALRPLSR